MIRFILFLTSHRQRNNLTTHPWRATRLIKEKYDYSVLKTGRSDRGGDTLKSVPGAFWKQPERFSGRFSFVGSGDL